MRKLSLLVLGVLITACAETAKPAPPPAVEGSNPGIIVTSADIVPGHSQYVALGPVRAECVKNPPAGHLTAKGIIADPNGLKQAAYRMYGSQVDAIVGADMFYVTENGQQHPVFDKEGQLECAGTAIHFQDQLPGIADRSH